MKPSVNGQRFAMLLAIGVTAWGGCATSQAGNPGFSMPIDVVFQNAEMVVKSDGDLPEVAPLIDQLQGSREQVSQLLELKLTKKPIEICVFQHQQGYRDYLLQHHPDFPFRRALFVKHQRGLKIFAIRHSRLDEDLRHEMTHAFLHSSFDSIPLWIDEGLAEYFEVPASSDGLNYPHVIVLRNELEHGRWKPDLRRLEALEDPRRMTQVDYAESWLWTHFLLSQDSAGDSDILRDGLQRLHRGEPVNFSVLIGDQLPDANERLIHHLQVLASDTRKR